jgi:hypothetical protein
MRDKVLGYGWPFRPEWSSNSTRKPRFFDWTADPKQATVDVAVYIGGAIQNGIDAPGRKIGWILESPEIARWQNTTPFIEQNLERVVSSYEVVLASDRKFCMLHPNIVYHPAGSNLPWVPESRYGIYRKTRMCSMFASTKKMVEAHRYRQRVAERLRHKLDLYGGACGSPRIGGNGPSPDKSDGLIPYRFQVVIENASADLYYTEKITDCFATGTVPIYWGAPTIDELFDSDGIIRFDDDFDPDALGEDLYYSMMPAIRENFRRVQELEGADDLLYRRFIRGEDAGPWKSGAASGHGPNRCNAVDAGVPWKAWEANRILAMTRSVPGSEKEHLRVVTATERKTIASVAEIPPELVTVRHVASTMAPLQSAGSAGAIAMEQLNKAFLLHLPDAFIGDNVVSTGSATTRSDAGGSDGAGATMSAPARFGTSMPPSRSAPGAAKRFSISSSMRCQRSRRSSTCWRLRRWRTSASSPTTSRVAPRSGSGSASGLLTESSPSRLTRRRASSSMPIWCCFRSSSRT